MVSLAVASLAAWGSADRVLWLDTDGAVAVALLESQLLQAVRVVDGRQLWARRAPSFWAHRDRETGPLTIDWAHGLVFGMARRNAENAPFRLITYSLANGARLYRRTVKCTWVHEIKIACDSSHRRIFALTSDSDLEGPAWHMLSWTYTEQGCLTAACAQVSNLSIDCDALTSLVYDAAYRTLVGLCAQDEKQVIYVIGTRSWRVKRIDASTSHDACELVASRGRLFVRVEDGRVAPLEPFRESDCSALCARVGAWSASLSLFGGALTLNPITGELIVPSACQPAKGLVPETLQPWQNQQGLGARARVAERLQEILPSELARLIAAYHGWFDESAPVGLRLASKRVCAKAALSPLEIRTFWDDTAARLAFCVLPKGRNNFEGVLDSFSLLDAHAGMAREAGVFSRKSQRPLNSLILSLGDRVLHFGSSGLWTRTRVAKREVFVCRRADTGVEVTRSSAEKNYRHRPRADLRASVAGGDLLALCPDAPDGGHALLRISKGVSSLCPRAKAVLPFTRADGFACTPDARLFVVITRGALQVFRNDGPLLARKLHWPVGKREAVFVGACGNECETFDGTARAHLCAEEMGDDRCAAVSADGTFLLLIVGDLLVLMSGLANKEPNVFAARADDVARACGLTTPWHLSDVFICPSTDQMFATGGFLTASFSRAWFCAFASQPVVSRISK